jgi:hypothetical protein
MRKVFVSATVLFCLFTSTRVLAQDVPQVEVFGGYSYLKGNSTRYNGFASHGWDASLVENLNRWVGLEADLSDHYGTSADDLRIRSDVLTVPLNYAPRFTFLFGPHFSYRKSPKITPFAHALSGGVRGTGTVSFLTRPCGPGIVCGITKSQTALAMAFGGGLDGQVARHISIRLIQADYLRANFSENPQNNARISAGIVFTFGRR